MTARFRDDLLPLGRAAAYTGLPRRTLQYLANSDRLRFLVLAGTERPKRWFRRSDLDALLRDPPARSQRRSRPPLKEVIVAYMRDRPSAAATVDEVHQGVIGLLGHEVPRSWVAAALYSNGRTFWWVKRGVFRLTSAAASSRRPRRPSDGAAGGKETS